MRNEKGFTLIELLVVVAIIGILAAIAIPQFAEYKTRAFNSRAQSDLRNALTAEEAYFVDHERYLPCDGTACVGDSITALPGFSLSQDVQLAMVTADEHSEFGGGACHSRGDRNYTWVSQAADASEAGVMQNAPAESCTAAPDPELAE